jgi:UDP-N-acetylglucosamine 2-epimerase (non-hydrolysing)
MSASVQRVLAVYGTRPEAIKMAPLVAALRARAGRIALRVCTTGQHRELIDQARDLLALHPDIDLELMRPAQTLNDLAARAFAALDRVLVEEEPDWLLVQGDTTTAMVASLAAFHRGIRLGHVEAGLRTGDLARPFPEEANRRVVDVVASALFAPTAGAKRRLLGEGIDRSRVHLTGNTVIDALRGIIAKLGETVRREDVVLITVHRRESFGAQIENIFRALRRLAQLYPATEWIYPVHPNPQVSEPARRLLAGVANLRLIEPLDYAGLVRELVRARLVLTDSGGLQEEAPGLGKPVLVVRETTERPEGIEAGVARLIGTDEEGIVAAVVEVLEDEAVYASMATARNPYGDGRASERIVSILLEEPWEEFRA